MSDDTRLRTQPDEPATDGGAPAAPVEAAEWWENRGGFFGDLYLEADDSFDSFFESGSRLPERTEREVAGVLSTCSLKPGDRVLDCPSGYGRHSIGLAAAGMKVTGADINTRFLSLCRERAAARNVDATFVAADMRKLSFSDEFDAVINMFYSFGFFGTSEEDQAVLHGFHAALRPGGRFLMHTMITIDAFDQGRIPEREERVLKSGNTLVTTRFLDRTTGRENGEWSIVDEAGGVRSLRPYSMRIYSVEEFADMCLRAGFSNVSTYGDWDGSSYRPDSPYLIAVAEK